MVQLSIEMPVLLASASIEDSGQSVYKPNTAFAHVQTNLLEKENITHPKMASLGHTWDSK